MKCPKCRTENPPTSKFCAECATPLPAAAEPDFLQTETLQTPVRDLATGSTFAGRYQVIEELGRGGMGRVYRALDKKLNEEVAIKLIRPEIAADKDTLMRFQNELKTARKISHPHVGRMYELMEEKGAHFITMEYVPGQDLRGLIRQTGELTVGKTVSIGKEICEGLAEAHKQGIVHRDLKPSNIIIDRAGIARIMDFGIARSLRGKGITGEGVMIGTPEYMSPEQADAKEVDARSDIYSLGVILYEMATGRVPFQGDSALSIAMKHKGEIPKNPRQFNPNVPAGLSRVIMKCLEKDPVRRYQTAVELRSELDQIEKGFSTAETGVSRPRRGLKRLLLPGLAVAVLIVAGIVILWKTQIEKSAVPGAASYRSIAVLPFEDLSPTKDHEYLCEGIPETLINALNTIEELRVPARSSAFSFKGSPIVLAEIGQKLNVETVLEGSIQISGDDVRVTPRLVGIKDGYQIWSQIYNRKLGNLFSIQDDIAREIVKVLKVKLLGEKEAPVGRRYTENIEAYNLFLKGRYFWNTRSSDGLDRAIGYFEQAIREDPEYALAFSGLADCYTLLPWYGRWTPKEALPKAKEAALKALGIDNTLGEAHTSLAAVHYWMEWNWANAEREFKRAIELSPRYPTGHHWYGSYLCDMGRIEESIAEIRQALELDPLSYIINENLGQSLYVARRYDESLEQYLKVREMYPNRSYGWMAEVFLMKGLLPEALEESGKVTLPDVLILVHYALGNKTEGFRIFEERMRNAAKSAERETLNPVFLARMYFAVGKYDLMFDALEIAYRDRYPQLLDFIKDPIVDAVREEPRYKALLKKMNFPKSRMAPPEK